MYWSIFRQGNCIQLDFQNVKRIYGSHGGYGSSRVASQGIMQTTFHLQLNMQDSGFLLTNVSSIEKNKACSSSHATLNHGSMWFWIANTNYQNFWDTHLSWSMSLTEDFEENVAVSSSCRYVPSGIQLKQNLTSWRKKNGLTRWNGCSYRSAQGCQFVKAHGNLC